MHSTSDDVVAQMPPQIVLPQVRKRAFKPRTVSGCRTCRVRRIKCDEAEPSCKQCLRGHRICDGYPAKALDLHEASRDSTSLITPPLSPNLFDIAQEQRCFDFFCHFTIPRLSGSFESPFWNQLLLQATHHERAIRHAAIALGCLHEHFELGSSSLSENDGAFALKQYIRAIGFITTPIPEKGKQAADVALMTCVLFVCFETLRGYYSAALSHIDGGVKIISELQQSSQTDASLCLSPTPYVPLYILNQIFSRLDAQASQISHGRPLHLLHQNLPTKDPGYDPDIPMSFDSLESARNRLVHIRACALGTTQSLPNAVTMNPKTGPKIPVDAAKTTLSLDLIRNSTAIRLKQWSLAFESFLQSKHDWSKDEKRAVSILKLHRVLMGINFSKDFVRAMSDEMIWDGSLQDFETMISYAEEVIESSAADKKTPTFTLDTEIVLPLFVAAMKCRHGRLRRKAIALLRQEQRQEGIWSSDLAARVAERLVEIEEEGLEDEYVEAEQVSRCNRVRGVEVTLDADRTARLKYVKMRADWEVDEIVEHMNIMSNTC